MCRRIGRTILITAVRTSRNGGICYLKKILAETNKLYCMNTDNNVVEMMQRLKHWLS